MKGNHAGDSLRTCFQMLTIPVECPVSDIASRFTVSGSNQHTLSRTWEMFFMSGWTGGGLGLQRLEACGGKCKMGITRKQQDVLSPTLADLRRSEIGLGVLKQNIYVFKVIVIMVRFLRFFIWHSQQMIRFKPNKICVHQSKAAEMIWACQKNMRGCFV